MPLLYLAKVNLNSKIYDVYNKTLDLNSVFDTIYKNISRNTDYITKDSEKYNDSLGNPIHYIKESTYSFQEMYNEPGKIITGKLVRTYNKPSEKLDQDTQKMVSCYVKESTSINFYYDVEKEMITFCERQTFGYKQFLNAFTHLLNENISEYEFEIFLQKNREVLEEKINNFRTVKKVKATLIPPNSNYDDLQELQNELEYMKQCKDTNATKLSLEYISDNMDMESKTMKDIRTAVSRGYGDITLHGINKNGKQQSIRSSHDAAYTINIQENISKKDFHKESNNLILQFWNKFVNKKSNIKKGIS